MEQDKLALSASLMADGWRNWSYVENVKCKSYYRQTNNSFSLRQTGFGVVDKMDKLLCTDASATNKPGSY